MTSIFKPVLVMACVATLGAPAFAQDMTQPYDPSVKTFAYEAGVENFCPAGLQPVRSFGSVACGTPNAFGYVDRSGSAAVAVAPVVMPATQSYSFAPSPTVIEMGSVPAAMDGM
ncbi:hypothetical protein AQS8620_02145 [Aquimixticola soesokkakensis]|uniref:Porin n=1 Tax=Aquimixticola soesokkakensis TaxID=1519096 RepID=A0A1Y5SZA2_9RHOB|nr:hypothetical protein [Aquimixticola soesokkakensis]SLN50040.1 hypothetical protein AQS8620_02145 [Aquimixticola soesokkakensis]